MKRPSLIACILTITAVSAGTYVIVAPTCWAHCDTTGGPVIAEARIALEKGDVTPVLKWVKKADEAEIKAAFARVMAVRTKGPEAKELADRYFFETLVRVHRSGEGAPYTGIRDEPVDPILSMADKSLADGSADDLIRKISSHMAAAIGEKFKTAMDARKRKDTSVEEGREFVRAYVTYTHFVEGIHAAITSGGDHLHSEAAKGNIPRGAEHKEHRE